jgi:hypothetical protein
MHEALVSSARRIWEYGANMSFYVLGLFGAYTLLTLAMLMKPDDTDQRPTVQPVG